MPDTLICFNTRFIVGGIETYYIRMFEWADKNGYRTVLALPEKCDFDASWSDTLKRLHVEVFYYKESIKRSRLRNSLKEEIAFAPDEKAVIVTPTVKEYVLALYYSNKYAVKANCLLYIYDFIHIRVSRIKLVRMIYRQLLVNRLWDMGLIFMDEETCEYARELYREERKGRIIRLGKRFMEFEPEAVESRYKQKEFVILSVCRMQFPAKGYVLGLMDTFSRLYQDYGNIRLIIIGNGPDYGCLRAKYDLLDTEVKEHINLLGTVPYDEVDRYMKTANVYVGMGTTLIDAANNGLIGIVASAYQEESYSFGFFHKDYRIVGGFKEETGGRSFQFYELLKEVYNASPEMYFTMSRETYTVAKENYGIDEIMSELTNISICWPKMKIIFLDIVDRILLIPRKIFRKS